MIETDFTLPKPIEGILTANDLPARKVLLTHLTVSHHETSVFSLGNRKGPIYTIRGKQEISGEVACPTSYYSELFRTEQPFSLFAEQIKLLDSYIISSKPNGFLFISGSGEYPQSRTYISRWKIMEQLEAISKYQPVSTEDLISKQMTKILEKAKLIERNPNGLLVLSLDGTEIMDRWERMPEN